MDGVGIFKLLKYSKVYEIITHEYTLPLPYDVNCFSICVVRVGFQHPHNTTDDSAGTVS